MSGPVETELTLPAVSTAMPSDYFSLLKPRVMSLVIFTALVGLLLAPGSLNPVTAAIAILCISVGAGASGALNMWYDADIDAVMSRTARRPIPQGQIEPQQALTFGLVLSAFSVLAMGVLVNWLAAFLLAFTIFFYAVIYTIWLKRSTPQNIVIGGAAGAFPPVIGWAAVTGSVSIESLVLFAIIFIWTPPHFWALALYKSADYERAQVPMMPNARGEASTRFQILAYSIALALTGILPAVMGFASIYYGIFAGVLGLGFVWLAARVWLKRPGKPDDGFRPEKQLFGYSIAYLFLLFAFLGTEAVLVGRLS